MAKLASSVLAHLAIVHLWSAKCSFQPASDTLAYFRSLTSDKALYDNLARQTLSTCRKEKYQLDKLTRRSLMLQRAREYVSSDEVFTPSSPCSISPSTVGKGIVGILDEVEYVGSPDMDFMSRMGEIMQRSNCFEMEASLGTIILENEQEIEKATSRFINCLRSIREYFMLIEGMLKAALRETLSDRESVVTEDHVMRFYSALNMVLEHITDRVDSPVDIGEDTDIILDYESLMNLDIPGLITQIGLHMTNMGRDDSDLASPLTLVEQSQNLVSMSNEFISYIENYLDSIW